jgi:CelD/BcsL family acetyltransferase involved in cellulose biosynthesis
MTAPLRIEVVEDFDGLLALEAAWNALDSRVGRTAFQTFAWNRTWWELVGARTGRHRQHILRWSLDGRCLGIAPFVVEQTPDARTLMFLGDPWNDYNDVLLPDLGTELGAQATALLAQHLREGLGADWDRVDLSGIPSWSPLFGMAATGPAGPYTGELAWQSQQRSLTRDEAGVESMSARRKIKRLEAEGALKLRLITDPDGLQSAVADFMTMHIRQWYGRPEAVAPFVEPEVMRFYTNSIPDLARAGLGLVELTLEAVPVGYIYGLVRGTSFMSYRPTYERELAPLSPGSAMHALAFPMLRRHGFSSFDFGRGVHSYKDALADASIDCLRLVL